MAPFDVVELASHVSRVRRAQAPLRDGTVVRDFAGGWLASRPGVEPGEFASSCPHRIYAIDGREMFSRQGMESAMSLLGSLGCSRAFLWLAPWKRSKLVASMLTGAGAAAIPHVAYLALACSAGGCTLPRPTTLLIRTLDLAEVPRLCASAAPWYGDDGVHAAVRIVERGAAEFHAAFEGDRLAALGLLTVDGPWGYLLAAGTDPAFRSRGAQSALICSRVRASADRGARWCSVETNTAAPVSLNNLVRCGFEVAVRWRVYRWDRPGVSDFHASPERSRILIVSIGSER